jgi:hypothetical protein
MRKKSVLALLLLAGVSMAALPQDSAARLLNLLDDMLSAAVESGRTSAPAQSPSQNPSFSLQNNTGFTIKNIFVCRAGDENWGENILGGFLYHGQSTSVSLVTPLEEGNGYNIRVVDVDGDHYSKYNVKIGDFSTVSMSISDFDFER